jgi:membrane associated rhomboid family serine protease
MFLPIGDDIEKRTFPIVGVMLLIVNVGMYLHTTKIWLDALPKPEAEQTSLFEMEEPPPPGEWLDFLRTWGLVPNDLKEGRYVGVFTHMFLHGDVFHLLGNMIMLWAFVGTLEQGLGSLPFLALYLFWGVVAGLAHAGWCMGVASGEGLPLIGASGAISGMIGAYFITYGPLSNLKTLIWLGPAQPLETDIPATVYVCIWVFFQLAGIAEAEQQKWETPVAWFAHAGGFTVGLLMLYPFRLRIKRQITYAKSDLLAEDQHLASAPTWKKRRLEAQPAEQSPPGPAPPPQKCPYCSAGLAEAARMGDTLLRCPNEQCKRLIYLG